MCLLVVSEYHPGLKSDKYYCAARVVLRIFGIGSVCIAVTMALERYLALTRPFLYQKVNNIFYKTIMFEVSITTSSHNWVVG